MRDRWLLAVHWDHGILFWRLWGGWLKFRSRDDAVLFSERYGRMPSWVVGPIRITWVKMRSSEKAPTPPSAR